MQLMGREWPCPHLLRHWWRPAERRDPPGAAVAPAGRCQGASGAALLVTGAISQIRQSRAGFNAPKAVITKAKGRSWSRLRNGKCSSCSSHYLSKRAGGDGDEFGDPTRRLGLSGAAGLCLPALVTETNDDPTGWCQEEYRMSAWECQLELPAAKSPSYLA